LISPILFSPYDDILPNSHDVDLAAYADNTVIIATSRKLTLLVRYLESLLDELQRWFSELRMAINISKRTAIIFARAGRRLIQPQPVTFFGETIDWVEKPPYLWAILDTRPIWSPHID